MKNFSRIKKILPITGLRLYVVGFTRTEGAEQSEAYEHMTKLNFCIINGPNLNLLGAREPHIYGSQTLEQLNNDLKNRAEKLEVNVRFFQSNSESAIIDAIHNEFFNKTNGLILNAAAYTHTSVAIADAIKGCEIPTIEVHLSNIHAREAFRRHSYLSPVSRGVICGLGAKGYFLALDALKEICSEI